MHYLFPIADCRSRAGDCNLELRLTSPPSTHETAYRLTGTVHVRCAPQPPGPDSQPATCNLQAALAEGGSVRICALATGLTEEAFLDAQGMFCQELELHPDADNALELAVCDSAGRELVRLPARVRHRPHGQPLDPEVVLAPVLSGPPVAEVLGPPWPGFAQLVKHCLHLAADTADATGRDRGELFEHIYTQERYAEQAYRQKDPSGYRECWDNLEKYAGYLDQLLHEALPRPPAVRTRSAGEEAEAGLEEFRGCLSDVWRQARAAGRADLEERLKRVAEQGKGLTQRVKADAPAAVRELRELLNEVARIDHDRKERRETRTGEGGGPLEETA